MELRFCDRVEAAPPGHVLGPLLEAHARSAAAGGLDAPAPIFVSLWGGPPVDGFATRPRLGGLVVQPAAVVLGLRAWEDAFEGTLATSTAGSPLPWALFEAEKLVRMVLHQSGLAAEILASPVVLLDTMSERGLTPRELFAAGATHGLLRHYLDLARHALRAHAEQPGASASGSLRDALHALLTARAMAHEALFCRHLPTLVAHTRAHAGPPTRRHAGLAALEDGLAGERSGVRADNGDGHDRAQPELEALARELYNELDAMESSAMPANPTGYEILNDWLVSQRMLAEGRTRA